MRAFIVAASIAALSAEVQADVLWGKAESGASLEDISAIYPDGIRINPTDKQKNNSGASLQYMIKNIDIVKKNFEVGFYFLDGKLSSVGLKHDSKDQTYVCEGTFDGIYEALVSKYGREIKKSRNGGLGVSKNASWSIGRTTISLNMFSFGNPDCAIFLNYSSRLSQESENL